MFQNTVSQKSGLGMKTHTLTCLAVLSILSLVLAACQPATSEPSPSAVEPTATQPVSEQPAETQPAAATEAVEDLSQQLIDIEWVLVGYGDAANPTIVEDGTRVTALFASDGSLSGSGGCNQYSTTYQLNGNQISVQSPFASTLMACEKGMEQESAYFAALGLASSFEFSEQGWLHVTYDSGNPAEEVLVFVKGKKPLTNAVWVLESFGDPNTPTPLEAGTTITAIFTDDGQVSGSASCNTYTAGYTTSGDQISIQTPATTLMACADSSGQESEYLAALQAAETYQITGTTLQIVYASGTGMLKFSSRNLPLENVLWSLTSMNGQSLTTGVSITALFEPGVEGSSSTLSGSAGCNNYTASYTKSGESLKIDPPATTKMMCAETTMQVEQSYLAALQSAQSYSVLADQLTITSANGLLVFVANRVPLEGTLWKLVSLGAAENPAAPAAGADFTAQFTRQANAPSGLMVGGTGCNDYNAVYAATLDQIKFNQPYKTNFAGCTPEVYAQEEIFFNGLNAASSYRILGDMLEIPFDGQILNFTATAAQVETAPGGGPLTPLHSTFWWLSTMNGQTLLPGSQVTAEFAINADGQTGMLSGYAGCNNYSAPIVSVFQVGPPATTMMMCGSPAGIMEQESKYLSILASAYSFLMSGKQLVINTSQGALIYLNEPQPMAPVPPAPEQPIATLPALEPSNPIATPPSLEPSNPIATPPGLAPSNPIATPPGLAPSNPIATPPVVAPGNPIATPPAVGPSVPIATPPA